MTRYHTVTMPLDDDGNPQEPQLVPFTDDEETAADAAEQAWADGQVKRDTLAQISDLENAVTDRRVREAILGTDNGWLKAQNDKIAALRKTL